MSKHQIEPLHFVDTTYNMAPPPPTLKRQLSFCKNLNSQLWQDDEQQQSNDSGYQSEEHINKKAALEKVYFELERPQSCTTSQSSNNNNGICCECKLSRQIEESYQSEKSKCAQQ